MYDIRNYIAGEFPEAISGMHISNVEPATGVAYSTLPDSDERDVAAAVQAALAAFPAWSSQTPSDRSQLLFRIADLLDERIEELAAAESKDTGKPLSLARTVDIPRAASNLRFFAAAVMHFGSESHDMQGAAINYTVRQPVGIVGCISPWNLPLYLFTWKIAPALAAGNCVIGKPSEVTPMTAHLLAGICKEAGLPPGVLNIVHGLGSKVGQAICEHPDVPALTFTGSTETGRQISRIASPLFKKLSLEMGGKNPNIVFADCNYEEMLQTSIRSSFSNQGQICLCGSRILVQKPIYDKFRKDFVQRTQALKVGDPLSEQVHIGSLVSHAHMEKVLACIERARDEGGAILCGGHRVKIAGRCRNGCFVAPTVIDGLPPDCRTNQEEIFGPVVTLIPFNDSEEATKIANGTAYGLSATIWTENLSRAHRVAGELQAGIVWVNCWMLRDLRTPFGGMKDSGLGREGGHEALNFVTEPKNVCVRYRDAG